MKRDIEQDVMYRMWPGGDIIALWPAINADNGGYLCRSYEHIGQHGAASYQAVLSRTRAAYPHEYATLRAELIDRGYKPHAIKRATPQHRSHRRSKADEISFTSNTR